MTTDFEKIIRGDVIELSDGRWVYPAENKAFAFSRNTDDRMAMFELFCKEGQA